MVEKGLFREDLFFRLNIVAITVPPLREREDDIFLLARYFAEKFSTESGTSIPEFTDRTISAFLRYHWPGNVRELENIVHRIVIMEEGHPIDVRHLPDFMRSTMPQDNGVFKPLSEIEENYIRRVLESVNGNKTRAAEILKIDRKTFQEKLKRMG